jgi:cell division septation protein DedD
MSYDFSFDKKSAILIVIGCVAIGGLLFFAGYIVGLDKGQSQPVVQASSIPQNKQATKSKSQEESKGTEEASTAEKQPAPTVAPAKAAPKSTQDTPPAKIGESKPSDAPSDAKQPSTKDTDKTGFSLQLGAFQTEGNAVKLKDNLKSKGYPVFLFRALDANGNLWHTVRLGHYADMKEATQAAAKMTGKEQISAWVRPSNAF